jgi:hypothetical protein
MPLVVAVAVEQQNIGVGGFPKASIRMPRPLVGCRFLTVYVALPRYP